jgi:hypothetical protein
MKVTRKNYKKSIIYKIKSRKIFVPMFKNWLEYAEEKKVEEEEKKRKEEEILILQMLLMFLPVLSRVFYFPVRFPSVLSNSLVAYFDCFLFIFIMFEQC